MSTYIPGASDQFGEMHLYQPDYGFLTKVYGTKQAEYDRGFNAFKSLANSAINNTLTNTDNQNFREEAIKKIQNSLKSVSGVDLSNPTNVTKAMSLLDPVTKDQDLAYDWSASNYINSQKQKATSYRDSSDPEKRRMYSDIAMMDIQFAEDDLRNAKRGDGSIQKIKPREFVPFDDVEKYLSTEMKTQGIKIEREYSDNNGYIHKVVNGQGAIKPFSSWAKMTMGNKFDRQFEVTGRVKKEQMIRGHMQENNVSRDEAETKIGNDILNNLVTEVTNKGTYIEKELKDLTESLNLFDKKYPNGVADKYKEKYNSYVELKKYYETELDSSKEELSKLKQSGVEHIKGNMNSIFSEQVKQNSYKNWASNTAIATTQEELKPDQKVLTEWQIASREKEAALDRQLKESQFQRSQMMERYKIDKNHENSIDLERRKGNLPSETPIGTYTPTQKAFGVDIVSDSNKQNKDQMFNNTFGADKGLLNLVIPQQDHGKYYSVISKVKQISDGENVQLSKEEIQILASYGTKLGIRIQNPNSQSVASLVIDKLTGATYDYATKQIQKEASLGKRSANFKYLSSFDNTLNSMRTLMDQDAQILKNQENIAKEVVDGNGNVKSEYQNVKVVGHTKTGYPIFDYSNVESSKKEHLDNLVSKEFTSRTRPYTNTYEATNINKGTDYEGVLYGMTNRNISTVQGDPKVISFLNSKPSLKSISELFDNSLKISMDPVLKKAFIIGNVGNNPVAKSLKLNAGEVIFEIPYSSIQNDNGSLGVLKKHLSTNTIDPTSLGELAPFVGQPFTTVTATKSSKDVGLDYSITGIKNENGEYGLGISFTTYNPSTDKDDYHYQFVKVDPSNPDSFKKVISRMSAIKNEYSNFISRSDEN